MPLQVRKIITTIGRGGSATRSGWASASAGRVIRLIILLVSCITSSAWSSDNSIAAASDDSSATRLLAEHIKGDGQLRKGLDHPMSKLLYPAQQNSDSNQQDTNIG